MSEDLELRRAFFTEAVDILDRVEGEIEAMAAQPQDKEMVNAVFRGLHTIKGNSSFLGLDKITKLAHASETLLDKARKAEMPITPGLLDIVRQVFQELKVMIGEQETERAVDPLVNVIQRFMAGDTTAVPATPAPPAVASAAPTTGAEKKIATASVRVDESKISKILSLVSELELLRYSLERVPEKMDGLGTAGDDLRFDLELQLSKLSRLTRSLSGVVFGVRLVPVNTVFQRFPRVVQDLATKLGKEIRLEIVRGDAELDKTIVEAIADPMTHLIRNSADHGIEPVEERTKAGKRSMGTIRLNSYVRGNFVYIEITDDGRGMDGDKILKKAVEKGIVPVDRAGSFTEAQKLGLIFAPGFSTAEKVTDISGRGVGMDVVKSNINKLKGTVIIESKVGRGTVIQLRFPMSVAVLFSLFFEINNTSCAIPVDLVEESINYRPRDLMERLPEGENPNGYYAIYSLRNLLWRQPELVRNKEIFHVIRLRDPRGQQIAFIIDDFSSIEEAIVQSVDSYIAALPGIQGATVRKDGSVALVLSPQSLVAYALRTQPFAYAKIPEKEKEAETGLSDFLDMANGK